MESGAPIIERELAMRERKMTICSAISFSKLLGLIAGPVSRFRKGRVASGVMVPVIGWGDVRAAVNGKPTLARRYEAAVKGPGRVIAIDVNAAVEGVPTELTLPHEWDVAPEWRSRLGLGGTALIDLGRVDCRDMEDMVVLAEWRVGGLGFAYYDGERWYDIGANEVDPSDAVPEVLGLVVECRQLPRKGAAKPLPRKPYAVMVEGYPFKGYGPFLAESPVEAAMMVASDIGCSGYDDGEVFIEIMDADGDVAWEGLSSEAEYVQRLRHTGDSLVIKVPGDGPFATAIRVSRECPVCGRDRGMPSLVRVGWDEWGHHFGWHACSDPNGDLALRIEAGRNGLNMSDKI